MKSLNIVLVGGYSSFKSHDMRTTRLLTYHLHGVVTEYRDRPTVSCMCVHTGQRICDVRPHSWSLLLPYLSVGLLRLDMG